MLISHWFLFTRKTYKYFIGLIRFNENKVAVAAAGVGGEDHGFRHTATFFTDVDISKAAEAKADPARAEAARAEAARAAGCQG